MEDIKYMTDQELVSFSQKSKVKSNSDVMDYVAYELFCRFNDEGHNGESRLRAGLFKRLYYGNRAKKAEKKHSDLK